MSIGRSDLSQEKVVVVVMAELKGNKLLCVIPVMMWRTLPFNKLFSNLVSVRTAEQKLLILLLNFTDSFTFPVTVGVT